MGSSAANQRPSFTRGSSQQSVRRALSAIHASPPCLSHVSNHCKDMSYGLLGRDNISNAMRSKTILRRHSLSTPVPSPTSQAATPPPPREELPALPFSKDGSLLPQRQSSREKKFQRRYSPVTLDIAQKIVTKLTDENQYKQRHSTKVGVTDRNDRPRQRPAVTFALILPSVSNMENKTQRHRGFCKDYSIGETIRSPSHMIIEPTSEQAIQDISLLNKHDFAFVKRSDGSHSFAILAYHSMEPTKKANKESMEECMTFVISEDGATKMVRKSRWSESIHLVFMEGFQPCSVTTTNATANSTTKTCDVPKCYELDVRMILIRSR